QGAQVVQAAAVTQPGVLGARLQQPVLAVAPQAPPGRGGDPPAQRSAHSQPPGDGLGPRPAGRRGVAVVAALAIPFAQAFPQLHGLGIDVLDRPLELARRNIAASDVAARVTVRKQDVAGFTDDTGFDLAYLPAPFVPRPALQAGLPRIAAALRPGGWVFVANGKFSGTPAEAALTRLKTLVYGGTPLDEAEASDQLRGAGLTSVRPVPTPEGAPGITIGQKPA